MLRSSRYIQKIIVSFSIILVTTVLHPLSASAQNGNAAPVAHLVTSITPNTEKSARPTLPNSPSLSEATSIERRAFELTNKVRIQNGLKTFEWDPDLCRMARQHSENMARLGFFSHVTPAGQRLRDRVLAIGIEHFKEIAENIAYNQGYDDPGAFAVERWMVSAGHRGNILNRGFEAAAVGAFVATDGTVYLTQAFITR